MNDGINNLIMGMNAAVIYSSHVTEEGVTLVKCELLVFTGTYTGFGKDRNEAESKACEQMIDVMTDALDVYHGEISIEEDDDFCDLEENEIEVEPFLYTENDDTPDMVHYTIHAGIRREHGVVLYDIADALEAAKIQLDDWDEIPFGDWHCYTDKGLKEVKCGDAKTLLTALSQYGVSDDFYEWVKTQLIPEAERFFEKYVSKSVN